MFRPISSLLIGIDLIKLLEKNGFFYVEDIESAPDAAAKIVDPKIIKELLKPPEALLALKYWQTEIECERVKTFINKFDNLLNGGFQCGTINEICGQRGSGKTQICFQISLSVQLPKKYGGLEGKSLYIDTRNGFSTKRLQDMIKGYNKLHPQLKLNEDQMLDRILVMSPGSPEELCSELKNLNHNLETSYGLRLIIVDSLTFPIISSVGEPFQRIKYYTNIIKDLQAIAMKHKIAVVMTSELSNQIDSKGEHCVASIAGITVAHRVHRRLMLARIRDNRFAAKIIKSNILPQTIIPFDVTTDGTVQ